jgi:hypothetical protein
MELLASTQLFVRCQKMLQGLRAIKLNPYSICFRKNKNSGEMSAAYDYYKKGVEWQGISSSIDLQSIDPGFFPL